MQNNKLKTLLVMQIQMIGKHLQNINKELILDLSIKIFPTMQCNQPYMCLYTNLKRFYVISRSKRLAVDLIVNEIITKALTIDSELGKRMTDLLRGQPQFIQRFQSSTHNIALRNENSQAKIDVISSLPQIPRANEEPPQIKVPLKLTKQIQETIAPVQIPIRNGNFYGSPILSDNKEQGSQQDDPSIYKIGLQKSKQASKQIKQNVNGHNKNQNNFIPRNNLYTQSKVDALAIKRKNHFQRISLIHDPLSSGRSVVSSPLKNNPLLGPYAIKNSVFPLPSSSPKTTFFPPPSQQKQTKQIVDKYFQDSSSTRNLSHRSLCLCETSCENIVLSQDSFICIHCHNIYHTKCMKKTKDSQNCVICHLKYLIPNKLTHQQIFVGVLRKTKKKHQVHFNIGQQAMNIIKCKKDFSFRVQVRCFRLKPQTVNINLFPDSCTISLNGKQLKQFKPLHKQSSLKYRKDEPISILRNYQLGDNKLTITQFNAPSYGGIERIQPEDHLIGLYLIQEETLNSTVQRIVRNYLTTLQQSKDLLASSFYLNDVKGQNQDQQLISCEVIKIPLTCALTTEKLKYPARGIFCKHFQCFDLRNYILMTSSSSNPRWVCPICKAPCYEYRIDCILAQILNQYAGCDKVQQLMLYKDGAYDVLDREQDPIDQKGNKQHNPKPKHIDELNIQERLKRQRQKQRERQLLKLQQIEQKKKRRALCFPPQDQIVDLLSDSD